MASTTPNADHVSRDIEMHILLDNGGALPMPCTMSYSVTDPFAVSATFRSAEGSVTWVFSRDLLIDGLRGAAGHGDIRVATHHRTARSLVVLELSSPSGRAEMEAPFEQVQAFVSETVDLLPPGFEWQYLNFDSGLAALLADESPMHDPDQYPDRMTEN